MSVVRLTEADNGRAITAPLDDVIELALEENATTGFRWQVVRADGLVELPDGARSSEPRVPPSTPQIGAGGTRVFRFRAGRPGAGRLELKLWREFEGERSVVRRFTCDVTVAE